MLSIMAEALKPRWYRLTPDRLVLLLLVVEGLVWLSERLGSPAWHKGYAVLTAAASVGLVLLLMLLWCTAGLVFRWRFQFSIGSLLLLVVAVAVACSWMAVEVKNARKLETAVEESRMAYWEVRYEWQQNAIQFGLLKRRNYPGQRGCGTCWDRISLQRLGRCSSAGAPMPTWSVCRDWDNPSV